MVNNKWFITKYQSYFVPIKSNFLRWVAKILCPIIILKQNEFIKFYPKNWLMISGQSSIRNKIKAEFLIQTTVKTVNFRCIYFWWIKLNVALYVKTYKIIEFNLSNEIP